MWLNKGAFNPDELIKRGVVSPDANSFSMVLPPPNVTGVLHLGSSMMIAIQDSIIRRERMMGKKTLWIPGSDHAAIATQSVVEKKLEKEEGKRKHDLGREEFLKRVNDFALTSRETIKTQMMGLGASLDWSREAYTLDEARNLAVRTAFKKMYDDGLIYQKNKVINWDPKGQTTISDDEIVYEERDSILYTFYYGKMKDGNNFPIPISTTRLETKFGDHAVAVHPSDERYKEYIGKTFDVNFLGEEISLKVIADHSVEKEFGTGALGVTPAHSMMDAEIAMRHNLPMTQIIDEFGKLMVGPEGVKGKKAAEARIKVAELLKEAGLIISEENVKQNISTAERTGGIIEPLPKLQWFIDVSKKTSDGKSLKENMLAVVLDSTPENQKIEFIPTRFENVYKQWIENLRDWCISRQIWFGHQIPVWYKKSANSELIETICQVIAPQLTDEEISKGIILEQDPDTLDTWFSSGLWTFSTLGWPNEQKMKEQDFGQYHPNSLLETGRDIIFFWVARMILMTTYLTGQIPFKKVYLHGLVTDEKGRKISKSLGNNIDPLDMIAKYGADALRMSLIVGTQPGQDSKFSEVKIKEYRNFANKLWNASRFVFQFADEVGLKLSESNSLSSIAITEADTKLIDEAHLFAKDVSDEFEKYHLHLAAEKTYHFIWNRFAAEIIEESKNNKTESRATTLLIILKIILKTTHPFMPFVTEAIWQHMDNSYKQGEGDRDMLITSTNVK